MTLFPLKKMEDFDSEIGTMKVWQVAYLIAVLMFVLIYFRCASLIQRSNDNKSTNESVASSSTSVASSDKHDKLD